MRTSAEICRSAAGLLASDLMRRPLVRQLLEKALNPVLGRSVVVYFVKADV